LPAALWRDGVEIPVTQGDPYTFELEDMAAAIAGERPPRLGRADALGQARAIEALYRAAEVGGSVAVPVPVAAP
jgi:predicted dehydrogenase